MTEQQGAGRVPFYDWGAQYESKESDVHNNHPNDRIADALEKIANFMDKWSVPAPMVHSLDNIIGFKITPPAPPGTMVSLECSGNRYEFMATGTEEYIIPKR